MAIESLTHTATTETHLAGLALVVSPGRRGARFAALEFDGDTPRRQVVGTFGDPVQAQQLLALAEGTPIVTDAPQPVLELLARAGVRHPIVWDVLELASLVVPACPGGSLERASTFFGLHVPGSGLAGAAAQVAQLFALLVCLVDRVETPTLLHINRLAAGLDWPLRVLFAEVARARASSSLETGALAEAAPIGAWIVNGAAPRRRQAFEPVAHPPSIDLDDLARRLAPGAEIAHALGGYEARQEQVHMARAVGEALNDGARLLVEAGTGTGKSLAYLLPAALYAARGQRRVVVSTATTTLQDQLFNQDLPLVQASLAPDSTLRATVLKGRANYLCLRRWQTLLQASDLSPADRTLLIRTLFWLPSTLTGDRAELRLSPAEEEAWQRVSAVTEACTPTRCSYHRIGVCYLARARRAAEESHIVIANHALLLTDMSTRSRVLPDYQVLVVDEAHHLEDEATQQLGWRAGERELLNRLERLWSPGLTPVGAVPEALGIIAAAHGLRVPEPLLPELRRGEQAVAELGLHVRMLFEALARLLEDRDLMLGGMGDESSLRLNGAVRAGSAWQEIEDSWTVAADQLQSLERVVVQVCAELEGLPEAPDSARDLASELNGQLEFWRELRRRLQACIHTPDQSMVYWVSGGTRFRSAWLNAAPLEVASLLRGGLFAAPEAVVLVSATLAIGGSFDYARRRLGLEDARAVAVGSPFDYRRAALLYVPNDLPDPSQSGYQAWLERAILDVVLRLGGRTLVLFTSRAHLRLTYQALKAPLAAERVTLLGQGIDESSRTRLLDAFRQGGRVTLFGTNAFWEGIDVVGDALSCVVVARLPFAVPTDPVYAARAEQFEEPFSQYAVPQAVLRLKQGFGRLIRSRADRGAVVVLDRRLVTRSYGNVFVRSLPPCSTKQGPVSRTGREVESFVLTPGAG